jgi:hypothetical protein
VIKLRRMRWTGRVASMGKGEIHVIFCGKARRKRPLGRPRRRWENNIKIDLREIYGVVWTGFFWLRIETGRKLLRTR